MISLLGWYLSVALSHVLDIVRNAQTLSSARYLEKWNNAKVKDAA